MSKLVTREQIRGMGSFVITLALPALIIKGMADSPIDDIVNPGFLLAYSAGSLASFSLGFFILRKQRKQSLGNSAIASLGMSASNTGFIGYPIAAMVVGPSAALGVAMAIMVETVIMIPLAQTLADAGHSQTSAKLKTLLQTAKRLARSPLIIAIATGLTLSLLELQLPAVAMKVIDMLAVASAPVALFVIGGTLYGLKARGLMADVAMIAAGKLIIHPTAIALAFLLAPSLDPNLKT
ncbi:MAG TPA: AEC family transporter, partial [Candidimonas sp.]|nr:AEC family transporter [Candidimonas sp.]